MMKMARASEADLRMAMDLSSALDQLGQQFVPCMPQAIAKLVTGEECEHFDSDDDAQCGRAMRYLLEIAARGSLGRVIFGMAVLLDPTNRMVDSAADTLEHHPDNVAVRECLKSLVDRDFTYLGGKMAGAKVPITRDEVLAARDLLAASAIVGQGT